AVGRLVDARAAAVRVVRVAGEGARPARARGRRIRDAGRARLRRAIDPAGAAALGARAGARHLTGRAVTGARAARAGLVEERLGRTVVAGRVARLDDIARARRPARRAVTDARAADAGLVDARRRVRPVARTVAGLRLRVRAAPHLSRTAHALARARDACLVGA